MSHSSVAHYINKTPMEREKTVQVRLTALELERLHKLAHDSDETVSRMVRRLAREEWERRGLEAKETRATARR